MFAAPGLFKILPCCIGGIVLFSALTVYHNLVLIYICYAIVIYLHESKPSSPTVLLLNKNQLKIGGGGQKIKSNTVCKIGQQKQVQSSLLVSFLYFPSGATRNEFTPCSFVVTFHLSLRPTDLSLAFMQPGTVAKFA